MEGAELVDGVGRGEEVGDGEEGREKMPYIQFQQRYST